jgi:nitroreductase
MNVKDALSARKSTRAFLDKPVATETVVRILDAARHAPSGANTQPWQVAVVRGEKKRRLGESLEHAYRSGVKPRMDYNYYPVVWESPYTERRKACGYQLYETLGISRDDKQRRGEQWVANYRAFGAPVELFFFMDAGLEAGSYVDYGMFLQSVMLAAVEEGLATCPQAALADFPDIVKRELGYPPDRLLICGMALGYEDTEAKVNSYRTPREPVQAFARFFE